MQSFRLAYCPFPDSIRGIVYAVTKAEPNKEYMILVDQTLDEVSRRHALKHELAHIFLGHFEDDRTKNDQSYLDNMDTLEREADRYADQMTEDEFTELMTYQIGTAVYA